MIDDEYKYDLFWHALNYRTAASEYAEELWQELDACVKRLIEKEIKGIRQADAER